MYSSKRCNSEFSLKILRLLLALYICHSNFDKSFFIFYVPIFDLFLLIFFFFLKTFPAVYINVSSALNSKFSTLKFIFCALFVCHLSKSSHLRYAILFLMFQCTISLVYYSIENFLVYSYDA